MLFRVLEDQGLRKSLLLPWFGRTFSSTLRHSSDLSHACARHSTTLSSNLLSLPSPPLLSNTSTHFASSPSRVFSLPSNLTTIPTSILPTSLYISSLNSHLDISSFFHLSHNLVVISFSRLSRSFPFFGFVVFLWSVCLGVSFVLMFRVSCVMNL